MKEFALAICVIASLANIGFTSTSSTICCDFFPDQEIITAIPLRGPQGKKYNLYEAEKRIRHIRDRT